jgi:hypothetical protein
VAGHKAAVFDSAPRIWQGAPRVAVDALDKRLAGTQIFDQSTQDFSAVLPALA